MDCRTTRLHHSTYCVCVHVAAAPFLHHFLQISTMQQQPIPTITSRLEILSVLAQANDLSSFGHHTSGAKELADYLKPVWSSKRRRRRLLLEQNLLHRLTAAVTRALQLIGQGQNLEQVADDTLQSIALLCGDTVKCIHWVCMNDQREAAGMPAVIGEWCWQGSVQHSSL